MPRKANHLFQRPSYCAVCWQFTKDSRCLLSTGGSVGHGKAGEANGSIGLRLRSQCSAEGGTGGAEVRKTLSQAELCLLLEHPLFPNAVLNVLTCVAWCFEPTQRGLRGISLLCRVKVGGGKMEDVLMNVAMQPFVWASAAALWLSYSGSPLPALVRFTYSTVCKPGISLCILSPNLWQS